MNYTDAILHIADLPALAASIAQTHPEMVSDEGTITGFASTPATSLGVAALVYVRLTEAEVAQWRGTSGVTILAEAPYEGGHTPDLVYSALEASPASMALYDAVYPRTPITWTSQGVEYTTTPPFRFGVMG